MNDIVYGAENIVIKNIKNFSLEQTLDCGQAFRWRKDNAGTWCGIADGKYIELCEENGDIIVKKSNKKDFESFWIEYFDLKRDYSAIIESFSGNEILKRASVFSSGIRILRQQPWEALCSFIISQNNNIPRIKGIIDRLCENFGEKLGNMYTFPNAEVLAKLCPEDLSVIKSGFRAKYIIDAAKRISSGEIDLDTLGGLSYDCAQKQLLTIKGVGPKVADCALLYGCGHIEAFPKDVWIKRALDEFFEGKIPECALKNAGIAQQYIFYYTRNGKY